MRLVLALVFLTTQLMGCASFNGTSGEQASTVGGGGGLNFNYSVSGNTSWRPVAVFDDGIKTIIEMAPAMAWTEAPTLLIVRRSGGLFRSEELVLVNYRVQNNRYIVDALFNRAILVVGIGSGQERVTIQRGQRL